MSLHTSHLKDLLAHLRGGEAGAADELFRQAGARLETMARAMLRSYPAVAAQEQTGDMVQEAVLSLLGALQKIDLAKIADTRAFFALVSQHLNWRLLDLARRQVQVVAPAQQDPDADLDRWTALHEEAERLPMAPREVFALRFYHGWTLAEIAELLGVSKPTARRRWLEASALLAERLDGKLPE